MSWVKLDDQFFRKHRSVGGAGRSLYMAAQCHIAANMTDGKIDRSALPLILVEAEVPKGTVARLVDEGLWEETEYGYFDAGYLDNNPTAAEVLGIRDGANARMTIIRSSEECSREQADERSPTPVPSRTRPMKETRAYTVEFEALWSLYPLKKAKPDAFKAFTARLRAGVDLDELKLAVTHYAEDCELAQREPRFVLHGATFFGPNERWKDYLEAPALTRGGKPVATLEELATPARVVDKPVWVCAAGNPDCFDGWVPSVANPGAVKPCECRA